ncbi:MAG: 1-acyl-sn-glycerol-3-phosphate acyltransferase [Microthrixaceae bacterium]
MLSVRWWVALGPGSDPGDPLGAGDCEQLRPEDLAQPANATSSLVLALIGVWLLLRARRLEEGRGAAAFFGVVTLLAGLGSVDYHGIQTAAAQWTHDGGAALLVVTAVVIPVGRLVRRRPVLPGWSALRGVALAGAGTLAGLAYLGGRSGSGLCDPESVVQLHGLWHLMIGVVAALWATALWPVPAAPPAPGTWAAHRFLRRIVTVAARLVYRDIDTDDLSDLEDGPVVVVANHFGGLADAIVLMAVLPRRPRILADDAIWRVPVARSVMRGIGAVPVHRGRSGSTDNHSMFATSAAALDDGDLLLIFPEGVTRDEPSIGRVHTGAARIAAAAEVPVRVVPLGLHYADKAAFRSDVAVRRGRTVDVSAGEVDVDAVTDRIAGELRAAAPDYADWDEVAALRCAATVVLEEVDPRERVSIGERERLAQAYADLPAPVTDGIRAAAERFLADGARPVERRRSTVGARVLRALVWVLALPYATVGAIVYGVPVLLTWAASRLRVSPAVRATVVPIVALLTFLVATVVALVAGGRRSDGDGVLLGLSLLPVAFIALVYVVDTLAGLIRSGWQRLHGDDRTRRAELVEAVVRATGVAVPGPSDAVAATPVGVGPGAAGGAA